MSDNLDELRKQIDSLDEALLKTLGQRMEVVAKIGAYKKANGLDLRDDARFQALVSKQLERAKELGLPDTMVTALCELIHKYALEREAEV